MSKEEQDSNKRGMIVTFVVTIVLYVVAGVVTYLLSNSTKFTPATLITLQSGISVIITCLLLKFTWEIKEAINNSSSDLKSELSKRISVLKHFTDISDQDIRKILDRLTGQLDSLILQASQKQMVTLNVDELYKIVSSSIENEFLIRAVDLEPYRWESDTRDAEYFASNRKALIGGANIYRIFVINPNVNTSYFLSTINIIERHNRLNEDEEVKKSGGHIEIRAIHYEDLPKSVCGKDYLICGSSEKFETAKVLVEYFNRDWFSTYSGDFIKDPSIIRQYENTFDLTWERSQPLGDGWDKWCNRILAQLEDQTQ